jgi:hypothetical protein
MTRMTSGFLFSAALLAFAGSGLAQQPAANSSPLVVVELFQSQGCSSCPPAEANLNAIAGQANILALSYGVTYWDNLGWKDTFATKAYTDRQWSYARHHRHSQVWTPQVYIDGQKDLVGSDRRELDWAVAQASSQGPSLSWQDGRLMVGAGKPANSCDVWLVRYDPRTINVAIGAGENSGRTLPHRNVVRELVHLGKWNGSEHTFKLPVASLTDLSTAALVQIEDGGDILSASRQTSSL